MGGVTRTEYISGLRTRLQQVQTAISDVLAGGQSASMSTPAGGSRSYTLANLSELRGLEASIKRELALYSGTGPRVGFSGFGRCG